MKSKICFVCGKENLKKNEVAVNQKMLGRKINRFYCFECFAEYLEISVEDLLDKIEDFKSQGCTLFK